MSLSSDFDLDRKSRPRPGLRILQIRFGVFLFAALSFAQLLALASLFRYRAFEWSYPFLGGDGAEWLSNGLRLAGEPVRSTGRQPLLPFVLSLFARAEALPLFPWFPLALAALLETGLFLAVRRERGGAVAWACGLYLLAHHALLEQSAQVMADLLATALLAAALFLFLAGRRSPWREGAGSLFAALALLAQQIVLVPLAACLAVRALSEARAARRSGLPWRGAALRAGGGLLPVVAAILLPNLLWQLRLRSIGGADLEIPRAQWGLLRLHFASADHSAALALAFFGLPACGLVALELARLARRAAGRRGAPSVPGGEEPKGAFPALGAAVWLLGLGAFSAFLYDYRASRFWLYALPPFVLLLGRALAALRPRPLVFLAASLAAILGGAWTQGLGAARAGLWPLPPVELVAGEEGEGDPPLAPRLEVATIGGLLQRSLPARALAARRTSAASRPLRIRDLGSVRLAVALYDGSLDVDRRYDLRDRLANALRRPTKFAPCSLFPPSWKGWRRLRVVERSGPLLFLRGATEAGESPWLLVAPERCVGRGGRGGGGEALAPASPALLSSIERRLDGPQGFVAVVAEGEGGRAAARSLALSLPTPNFFVLGREAAGRLTRVGPDLGPAGPYRLSRVRARTFTALLLEPAALSGRPGK